MAVIAPTGLAITNIASTAISIAWGFDPANESEISGFKVTLDGAIVASRSKTLRVYQLSGLVANHFNYTVGIFAYTAVDTSTEISVATGTYQLAIKPGAGTVEFTVTGNDWTRNIEWVAGGPHDGTFLYEWGIDELGRSGFASGTAATALIVELPSDTEVTPWVRASNGARTNTDKVFGSPITLSAGTAGELVGSITNVSATIMTVGWTGETDELKRVGATVGGSTQYMWPDDNSSTFSALIPDTDQNVSMSIEDGGSISQPSESHYTDPDTPPTARLDVNDQLTLSADSTNNPVTTDYSVTAFGGFAASGTRAQLDGTEVPWDRTLYPLMLVTITANGVNGNERSSIFAFYTSNAAHNYSMAGGFTEWVDDYEADKMAPADMVLSGFGRRCPWAVGSNLLTKLAFEKLQSPNSVRTAAAVRFDPGYQQVNYVERSLAAFETDYLITARARRTFRVIPEGSVEVLNTVLIAQGG